MKKDFDNIKKYINKIEQLARKDENVAFMPVKKQSLNLDMSAVEEYRDFKDAVESWETEVAMANSNVVPIRVTVRTDD